MQTPSVSESQPKRPPVQNSSLAAEILARRHDHLADLAAKDTWHKRHPTLGSLDPCLRAEYLSVKHWDKRPVPEPDLKARFIIGNEAEEKITRTLKDIGFQVIEGQRHFDLNGREGQLIATGRIDGRIRRPDEPPGKNEHVLECKSMNVNVFNRITALDDLQDYPWTRKYLWQLQGYLLAANEPQGILILDDLLGHWKAFDVPIDLDVGEWIMGHCEEAVLHIAADEAPDYHGDPGHCRRCIWRGRVCDPPLDLGPGIGMISDAELAQDAFLRQELDMARANWERLDKRLKEAVRAALPEGFGVGDSHSVIIGDFLAVATGCKYTTYEYPPEIKAHYARPGHQVRITFEPLKGGAE